MTPIAAGLVAMGVVLLLVVGLVGTIAWLSSKAAKAEERLKNEEAVNGKRKNVADILARRRTREQSRAALGGLLDEGNTTSGHPPVPGSSDPGGAGSAA